MKLTPARIAEARARCEAATPLYLKASHDYSNERSYVFELARVGEEVAVFSGDKHYTDSEAFIAARTDLPAALDDLEAAMKVVEAAQKYLCASWVVNTARERWFRFATGPELDGRRDAETALRAALAALGVEATSLPKCRLCDAPVKREGYSLCQTCDDEAEREEDRDAE